MIVDWAVPSRLVTSVGELKINGPDTDEKRWLLNPEKCTASVPVRATSDDVPQGHGKVRHSRWWSGFELHLAVQFWTFAEVACDSILQEMGDTLSRHINAMIYPTLHGQGARLYMQPQGYSDERMVLDAQLASGVAYDAILGEAEFDLDCDLPYMIDKTEIVTALPAVINNPGSTDRYAVMKVHGPTSAFTIANHSVVDAQGASLKIVYSSSLPGAVVIGGGHYVELDFFRNTAYLDGNGANRKPGIDIRKSDYFPLIPGDNNITVSGASVDVLHAAAWT